MFLFLFIILGTVTAVGGASAALVFTGAPDACRTHTIPVTASAAASLESKWQDFRARSQEGKSVVTFTESEITSAGQQYLQEQNVPLRNLQVYFCEETRWRQSGSFLVGHAEATGTYDGAGPSIEILLRGVLDYRGRIPFIDIQEIEGGRLPTWVPVTKTLARFSDDSRQLKLGVGITNVIYTNGTITIGAQPVIKERQQRPRPPRQRLRDGTPGSRTGRR